MLRSGLRTKGLAACLGLGVFLSAGWLGGCLHGGQKADLHDLFISSRRFNIDEERGLVRIYARLENTGDSRFRAVEVHATLVSTTGEKRGENSLVLEDLRPHDQRDFALSVTSHGRTHDVALEVRLPERP
jgi:hypothetical protein